MLHQWAQHIIHFEVHSDEIWNSSCIHFFSLKWPIHRFPTNISKHIQQSNNISTFLAAINTKLQVFTYLFPVGNLQQITIKDISQTERKWCCVFSFPIHTATCNYFYNLKIENKAVFVIFVRWLEVHHPLHSWNSTSI